MLDTLLLWWPINDYMWMKCPVVDRVADSCRVNWLRFASPGKLSDYLGPKHHRPPNIIDVIIKRFWR